jgi:hypothetical protein
MYISHNGLDWKLYAWDEQCQTRWEGYTTEDPEVSDIITFTDCSNPSSNQYVSSIEEVFEGSTRMGFMLWTDEHTSPIYSYYSYDGINWICNGDPIDTIGDVNSTPGCWNSTRNYNFDSVRMGTGYLISRSGSYNTGMAAVEPVNNPLPTTTGIDPSSKTAGDPGFTLTVDGTNFVASSTVRWNGADRASIYVSATQLTATILASDITTTGTFNVTVFNPAPEGGESNAQTFTVIAGAELSTVTTQAVTGIGTTTATGNGDITDLGSPNPTAHGVCWNTTGAPTLADSHTDEGGAGSTGAFTSNITGLFPSTKYYVRAYATNTTGTAYGNEVSFTTNAQLPTVTTQPVTGIGATTAIGNGNITDLGGPNPTAHGVCWNTTGTPTIADNSTNEGAASSTGPFTSNITGLSAGTTYYVRAYAINTAGTAYGNEVNFTTKADTDGDGLPDNLENSWCTDPNDADTDNDGIIDGVEDANHNGVVDSGETNPCNIDTDGDGIQDGTELIRIPLFSSLILIREPPLIP